MEASGFILPKVFAAMAKFIVPGMEHHGYPFYNGLGGSDRPILQHVSPFFLVFYILGNYSYLSNCSLLFQFSINLYTFNGFTITMPRNFKPNQLKKNCF